jgi:hypothetical protein
MRYGRVTTRPLAAAQTCVPSFSRRPAAPAVTVANGATPGTTGSPCASIIFAGFGTCRRRSAREGSSLEVAAPEVDLGEGITSGECLLSLADAKMVTDVLP